MAEVDICCLFPWPRMSVDGAPMYIPGQLILKYRVRKACADCTLGWFEQIGCSTCLMHLEATS